MIDAMARARNAMHRGEELNSERFIAGHVTSVMEPGKDGMLKEKVQWPAGSSGPPKPQLNVVVAGVHCGRHEPDGGSAADSAVRERREATADRGD